MKLEISSKKSSGFSFDTNNGKKQHFAKQTGFSLNAKEEIIAERNREKIEKDYESVVVHDFGDDYHLSEEEKAEKFQYYEAFKKLRRCKKKYRKLPEYIKAMRLCMETLDIIANNNGVYPPDKFKKMVAKKTIKVYGLDFPKYIGKDRKSVNWEFVAEAIADPNVPLSLFEKNEEESFDIDDVDDIEEYRKMMFGEHYESIFVNPPTHEEVMSDKRYHVKKSSNKEQKDFYSMFPEMQLAAKEMKRKIDRRHDIESYVYSIGESDFEYIERLDQKRGTGLDIPKFKGNILSKKDYDKYMHELEEFYRENVKISYRGKNRTLDEIRMSKLRDAFEDAGWNIRAMYKYGKQEKQEEKKRKEDKKKEKKLKKKLLAIQNRRGKKNEMTKDSGKKKNKGKSKKKDKSG